MRKNKLRVKVIFSIRCEETKIKKLLLKKRFIQLVCKNTPSKLMEVHAQRLLFLFIVLRWNHSWQCHCSDSNSDSLQEFQRISGFIASDDRREIIVLPLCKSNETIKSDANFTVNDCRERYGCS